MDKAKALRDKLDEIAVLTTEMEAEDGKNDTPDNREKLTALLNEGETIRKSIEQDGKLDGLRKFLEEPAKGSKVYAPKGGGGQMSEEFQGHLAHPQTVGDAFVNSDTYKTAIKGLSPGDKLNPGQANGVSAELKNFLGFGRKTTFDTTSTGLDSSRNYVPGVVLIEQQSLTIRDLLSVGQTQQNIVYFIKENSFANYADMVAEEGEKPEATLATTTANAPVKKIAVVLKVTDEMFADFPMLRDYINTRLTFMVQAKEEQQLLNGAGTGNEITGILNTSGIQTQAKGADSNFVAIHKAITKIRVAASSIGGYEPDGIVIHPTDWQILRIATDGNTQFYGGGPFMNQYGVGPYPENPLLWGLRPVITTAISAGTALVGAFKLGAQVWQREGIRVDSTNSNEDDFNFNRVTLRVEERLALAVYRPSAFCTVTSIA
jgi:HK97 family phage major capsid protein